MNRYTRPQLQQSALITIDTQNDFVLDDAPARIEGTQEIVPNMVRLLEAYRSTARPIVHIVRLYLADGSNVDSCRRQEVEDGLQMVLPDTPGAELVDALKPDPTVKLDTQLLLSGALQQVGDTEYILYKPRWGMFYQTQLDVFLHQHNINTLVFCGCNFPNCPRSSIYQASERDYRIVLVSDAMSQLYARGEQEMHDIGVQLSSTSTLIAELKT